MSYASIRSVFWLWTWCRRGKKYSSKRRPDRAAFVVGSKGICWIPLFRGAVCAACKRRFIERVHTKRNATLIKAKTLKGYSLTSLEGDIGSVSQFFFDDQYRAIRYLVANTGT
jgi:hypothetical protein